ADAEIDLVAGGRDDLAVAHDEGTVRLRAGNIGRKLHRSRERRSSKPRGDQAGQRTKTVRSRLIPRHTILPLEFWPANRNRLRGTAVEMQRALQPARRDYRP